MQKLVQKACESSMMAEKSFIKTLHHHIESKKMRLIKTRDDLSKGRYNAYHISISTSFINRSSPPEVFLGKGVQKIYTKFTGQNP